VAFSKTAQQMAAHVSPRTTGLYDRRSDDLSLDEVEKIGIGDLASRGFLSSFDFKSVPRFNDDAPADP
jgi:hypothetical protein